MKLRCFIHHTLENLECPEVAHYNNTGHLYTILILIKVRSGGNL